MNEQATCIQLTDNYRITRADDRNFEVEEFRSVTAHPNKYLKETRTSDKWVSIGYYSDIAQAVNGVLKQEESNITARERLNLEAAIAELKNISDDLKATVRGFNIKLTDFVKTDSRGKKTEVTVGKVTAGKPKKTVGKQKVTA
jgi:predicted metal-dependent phosphoesterase TrpH